MLDMDTATVRLLDEDVTVRREAAGAVDSAELAGRYALRQALLTDEDAEVRAIAARRLGDARDARFVPVLLEALDDAMPLVRDRVWRALARLGAEALMPRASRAVREEPAWWVRRAAVRAVASVVGEGAVEVLLTALEDPFWRVRHAAVQALGWLGERNESLRRRVREVAAMPEQARGPMRSAVAWLELEWGTTTQASPLGGGRHGEGSSVGREFLSEGPGAGASIASEDPAVTTARLEARAAESLCAQELVEWLGDPHEPLRALARRRLRERKDPEAMRLALHWLDEPRVPHAQDEARALLEKLHVDEVDLAARILATPPRPGALAWAARIAVKHADARLLEQVRSLAVHSSGGIRRSAVSALVYDPDSRGLVLKALGDTDEGVRAEVIAAWERRPRSQAAVEDFATALVEFAPRAASVRERRAVAMAAACLESPEPLFLAARDEDPAVRAVALRALATLDLLTETERQYAESHEDPWLRAAVLDVDSAPRVCIEDPDPGLRRLGLELVLADERAREDDAPSIALACVHSPDPWVRARAAEHLDPEQGEAELRALLHLSRDTEPMVRMAAASPLETCASLDTRLDGLILANGPVSVHAENDEDLRIAAWTWRLRHADAPAFARLLDGLRGSVEPPRVAAHLRTLTLTFPDALFTTEPELASLRPTAPARPRARSTARPLPPPRASSRPLGNTGLEVSPLVLSGAHLTSREPFFEAHEAGINTFFWEPRYAALTQFLRAGRSLRDRSVIVAGSYHSGASALRRDVEAALRRLRTSWLDVFLLFWVRAPERLSDEDFAELERLRAEGKLRAFGFSTHLRDLARDALTRHPWPVVMTRHSAAHPGAESAFFPEAQRQGTGVLTFTTTCYGRLLRPVPGAPPDAPLPSAVDCYRYSLSQPGVSASLTAPRNRRELLHNLDVLSRPWMEPDALAVMRAHGERVRTQGRQLDTLVRRAPGGPREALLALMEEDEPSELDTLPSS
ncbi:aldo/keto reductase [Myxococcus landrumensis]|uniref:HEAT repeat domain-containing protein n=1 Tax=Myxococcus landrumensis TaxID=2813577 RepID=A0ABX7N9K8_9BACT|nr:aldo/keto reductase [Myxococcus landrumus]QSQ14101.1 HEAT repeat domain-containing protein [Myxococcus landrumus]